MRLGFRCTALAVYKEFALLISFRLVTLGFPYVLVSLGCYNSIVDWVAYKQYKFNSQSSGGWEVQDQDANTSDVW